MDINSIINEMLNDVLIFDIECSSYNNNTKKFYNIKTEFSEYVKNAVIKWIGFYSYKTNEYFELNIYNDEDKIKIQELLKTHKTLVGFNSENFDYPILQNNQFLKYSKQNLDVMKIIGDNSYKQGFKNRGMYMGVGDILKKTGNSLNSMAQAFNLSSIKGEIDYKIFQKCEWTDEEIYNIKIYLHRDIELTKLLFDKLINFWKLFCNWIDYDSIKKWRWLNSSIAVLTYLAICKKKGVLPIFRDEDDNNHKKEEMGGRAVIPLFSEVSGVHYLDEVSKYPHLFSEFNLFNEISPEKIKKTSKEKIDEYIKKGMIFHGNEKFQVRGYYDIRKHGILEQDLINKLKTRFAIKKVLKEYKKNGEREIIVPELLKEIIIDGKLTDEIINILSGLEYAIKIFANSLYGIVRKSSFEQISTPNAGYDCCWIGQQIHEYIHKRFEYRGWKVIGGFTDSWFVKATDDITNEEIIKYANECLKELKQYMPFSEETHQIGYECFMENIIYSYDKRRGEYKKNNYAYISNGKIKIVGFPIMKSNASKLSLYIFKKYLEVEMLKNRRLRVSKKYIETIINEELKRDISLSSIKFKCKEYNQYKIKGQIQAQISEKYLNKFDGEIELIKNRRIGKVGKDSKYCSLEEAKKNKIEINDLVLDTVWNELDPFIEYKQEEKKNSSSKYDLSMWLKN